MAASSAVGWGRRGVKIQLCGACKRARTPEARRNPKIPKSGHPKKEKKEKTTLAVTATVSDSTAGISLEEAE